MRYLELLVSMKGESPDKATHLCAICLEEDSKPVIMPCAHSLCTQCHQRWVHHRLSCPFCRLGFDRKTMNQNQWELMEWQAKDAVEDIVRLEIQIARIWDDLKFASENDDLLQAYVPMKRYINVEDTDGIILVSDSS